MEVYTEDARAVNRGRDGFGSLRDQELHLPATAQALELGQAIVQALALSK